MKSFDEIYDNIQKDKLNNAEKIRENILEKLKSKKHKQKNKRIALIITFILLVIVLIILKKVYVGHIIIQMLVPLFIIYLFFIFGNVSWLRATKDKREIARIYNECDGDSCANDFKEYIVKDLAKGVFDCDCFCQEEGLAKSDCDMENRVTPILNILEDYKFESEDGVILEAEDLMFSEVNILSRNKREYYSIFEGIAGVKELNNANVLQKKLQVILTDNIYFKKAADETNLDKFKKYYLVKCKDKAFEEKVITKEVIDYIYNMKNKNIFVLFSISGGRLRFKFSFGNLNLSSSLKSMQASYSKSMVLFEPCIDKSLLDKDLIKSYYDVFVIIKEFVEFMENILENIS